MSLGALRELQFAHLCMFEALEIDKNVVFGLFWVEEIVQKCNFEPIE